MNGRILVGIALILLTGCTIQKRHYRSGYTVHWNKNYRSSSENHSEKKNTIKYEPKAVQETAEERFIERNSNRNEHEVLVSTQVNEKPSTVIGPFKDRTLSAVSERSVLSSSIEDVESDFDTDNRFSKSNSKSIAGKDSNDISNGDNWIYLVSGLMFLASVGGVKLGRRKLRKLTRWARNNPKSARYLITGIQVPLLAMSVYEGYNLSQMGYTISDTVLYSGIGLFLTSSAAIPFLPQYDGFVLPSRLNRRRMAFLTATIASCVMALGYGNNVGLQEEDSYAKNVLSSVDQAIFSSTNQTPENDTYDSGSSVSVNSIDSTNNDSRLTASAGLCALAILLYILLTCTLCAGICLAVIGLMGGAGGVAVGAVLAGIAIAGLSVYAMVAIARANWCR